MTSDLADLCHRKAQRVFATTYNHILHEITNLALSNVIMNMNSGQDWNEVIIRFSLPLANS